MHVGRRETPRKPVSQHRPGITAIAALGAAEISAKVKRVAAGICRIYQDHLVIKCLAIHQIHVWLVRVGIGRDLDVQSQSSPALAAISGAKQVALLSIASDRSEGVSDAVSRRAYGQCGSACPGEHI